MGQADNSERDTDRQRKRGRERGEGRREGGAKREERQRHREMDREPKILFICRCQFEAECFVVGVNRANGACGTIVETSTNPQTFHADGRTAVLYKRSPGGMLCELQLSVFTPRSGSTGDLWRTRGPRGPDSPTLQNYIDLLLYKRSAGGMGWFLCEVSKPKSRSRSRGTCRVTRGLGPETPTLQNYIFCCL